MVRRIAAALRAAGHETWLDEDDILVGESIPSAVERGLHEADFVVLCLSKVAAERGWVEAERDATMMQQFRERKERILPVRLDEVTPPGLVRPLAHVDLFPDEQALNRGIARLTRSIAAYAERHAGAAHSPELPSCPTLGSSDASVAPVGMSSAQSSIAVRPVPAYPDAEVEALSKRLEGARARRDKLRSAGIAIDHIEREILELRRQLREGGRLHAGDTLSDGRYLLVKVVGRGGFAVVWEAYDCVTQQRVAIKVLHANLAGDPLRRERFFRGAQAMMRVEHPAVVRVLEPKGEDGGFHYFVMEFVAGSNLRDAVLEQRLQKTDRLPLILRVGEALALVHARGMVHRDIKPANILLDEEGNAKLTDFDLVGAQDTTGGTRTGALGTIVYSAPECLEKPQEATARADVYGLGMTAIFCLWGRELSLATFRNPKPTIARLDCGILVRNVLRQAVAWNPDKRFADASAMMTELRHASNLEDCAKEATEKYRPVDGILVIRPVVTLNPDEEHRPAGLLRTPRQWLRAVVWSTGFAVSAALGLLLRPTPELADVAATHFVVTHSTRIR